MLSDETKRVTDTRRVASEPAQTPAGDRHRRSGPFSVDHRLPGGGNERNAH
jgi:hypothetical protein